MTQPRTSICGACGWTVHYVPTPSPWEFDGACSRCPHRSVISWAHKSPPPAFVLDGTPAQGSLEFGA